jgi:hypothetical protein
MDFSHDITREEVSSGPRRVTAYFKRAVTVDDLVFMQSKAYADARARKLPYQASTSRQTESQITRVPYAR